MKKTYWRLSVVLMAVVLAVGFTACSDDKDETKNNPVNPVEPSEDKAMSPEDQKEKLEKVALEFMDAIPSTDFYDIADLEQFVADTYFDGYDWETVEEWADDAFDAAREALGTKTTETETYGSYTDKYIYTNYKAILMASNFTGHFTARNGRWEQEKASDLQFIFTDERGRQCVIKLETSGIVKKVHVLDVDEWVDDDYDGSSYTWTEYYDRTQCTIGVPEKIIVTLTQGGSQMVKTTVNIDLKNISGEEFNISKNSLTVSTLIELNNGYKFEVSNVAYTASSKASASFKMSKNGQSLVTLAAAADVNDIPSVNVSAFSSSNSDDDFEKANAKNAFVKIDIIGKVQIQGTLSDVRKFNDYLEMAADNESKESTYKSYVNQANALAELNLFYDGKSEKQAHVRLEPFIDEEWGGYTYWRVEPVICFFDGSSYSTFEAFFNNKDFKTTIDQFKKLANRYASLIDEHIDW